MNPGELVTFFFLFTTLYFEVFLLVTFLENRKEMGKETLTPEYFPSVTVAVPCWNEEKTVSGTIQSLLSLRYPKEKLSIIAVDDGSTDGTWHALQEFKNHPQVRLYQKENGGKFTVLNFAITHSESDLFGCLDADSYVDSQALLRIVKRFENKKIMAVTPSIHILEPKTPIELLQKAEFTLSIFIRKVFALLGSVYITPGPFSFFRREVFAEIGGYKHAHNTEDMEIAMRMQKAGMKIDNAHDAYVYTHPQKTVYRLYRQRLRWIHGGLENLLDYRSMFFKKKYGNLSYFVLPAAILSVCSGLYFVAFALWNVVNFASGKIAEAEVIGAEAFAPSIHLNWFFLNTNPIGIISAILLLLSLSTILAGKYIGEKTALPSRDIIYFILFYGILSPFWLIKAIWNTALSRKTSWR